MITYCMCPMVLYLPWAALQSKQITFLCIEWSQKYLDTPSIIVFFNRIISHCKKSSQCHGWGRPGYFLPFLFFSNEMLKFRWSGGSAYGLLPCFICLTDFLSLDSSVSVWFSEKPCLNLQLWQYLKPKRRIYLKYSPACSLSNTTALSLSVLI